MTFGGMIRGWLRTSTLTVGDSEGGSKTPFRLIILAAVLVAGAAASLVPRRKRCRKCQHLLPGHFSHCSLFRPEPGI
jgi:hypothetical protein